MSSTICKKCGVCMQIQFITQNKNDDFPSLLASHKQERSRISCNQSFSDYSITTNWLFFFLNILFSSWTTTHNTERTVLILFLFNFFFFADCNFNKERDRERERFWDRFTHHHHDRWLFSFIKCSFASFLSSTQSHHSSYNLKNH